MVRFHLDAHQQFKGNITPNHPPRAPLPPEFSKTTWKELTRQRVEVIKRFIRGKPSTIIIIIIALLLALSMVAIAQW